MPCLHSVSWQGGRIDSIQTWTDILFWDARPDKNLATLPSFSRSQKIKECWKNALSALSVSWKEWMNFNQILTDILFRGAKELKEFGTLTSFSRSQKIKECWKMPCLHYFLEERIDLIKPAQIFQWEMQKNKIEFGDVDPIFYVTGCLRMLKIVLSARYHLKGMVYFNLTCTDMLVGDAKDLIRF